MTRAIPDDMTPDSIRVTARSMGGYEIALHGAPRDHAPTITVRGMMQTEPVELPVPRTAMDNLFRRAAKLRLPAVPSRGAMGVDGITVEVKFERGFTVSSYSWWVEPPAEWEALGKLVDDIVRLARRVAPTETFTLPGT